ncbi:MAG: B12-binding domain-containing radical SAM protein, partial [Clostridia bacterium]|nr:B12-binding domain-containing radical SAM protein [Clostridia bacterium]
MKDILLIGINSKYIHSNLAIRYMASYADLPFFECTINDDIFSVYAKLVNRKENYFCFSVYIWNVEFIKKLCSMLHSSRPDIKIILGGPEAGYNKEYFFVNHPFVFGVV